MDEAQIKALLESVLKPQLATLQKSLETYVESSIGAVRAEIPKSQEDTQDDDSSADSDKPSPALLATQKELAELKQQLADRERSEQNSRLENEILSYASSKGLTAPGLLVDAVQRRFKPQLVEDNGKWFFKDGENVTAIASKLDEFLGTNEGKALLPPTGANGGGATETVTKPAGKDSADPWSELAKLYAPQG